MQEFVQQKTCRKGPTPSLPGEPPEFGLATANRIVESAYEIRRTLFKYSIEADFTYQEYPASFSHLPTPHTNDDRPAEFTSKLLQVKSSWTQTRLDLMDLDQEYRRGRSSTIDSIDDVLAFKIVEEWVSTSTGTKKMRDDLGQVGNRDTKNSQIFSYQCVENSEPVEYKCPALFTQ